MRVRLHALLERETWSASYREGASSESPPDAAYTATELPSDTRATEKVRRPRGRLQAAV